MRLLISFVSALIFIFATTASSTAAAGTVTTVTTVTKTVVSRTSGCKQHKHYKHKKYYKNSCRTRYYYSPGYCISDPCACGGTVCYPAYYYQCRTEYYYHSGRNTARVEVCY